MAVLRALLAALAITGLFAGDACAAPSEYQVKAVFLYNFARFVEWPASAFATPAAPFVIGVVGYDPFGNDLDEATRGETVNGRALVVRRVRSIGEAADCQILFVHRSEAAHLDEIVSGLNHRSTLTVSDLDEAGKRGVMIALATQDQRIRLRVNVDSARAANLIISSKLLRSADIVSTAAGGS